MQGLKTFQKPLDLLFEHGQVVARGIPYEFAVEDIIAVSNDVSETDNPLVF